MTLLARAAASAGMAVFSPSGRPCSAVFRDTAIETAIQAATVGLATTTTIATIAKKATTT